MHRLFSALSAPVVFASTLVATGAAWAQVPISSMQMTFIEPTAAPVQPTDLIPVWIRFKNNDPSNSFVINSDLPLFGLDPQWVPTVGTGVDPDTNQNFSADFATYDNIGLVRGYGCSGSFTVVCDPGAYQFDFAFDDALANPVSIAPGASLDYLLGTFFPVGGAAPAGTYEFYRAAMFLDVSGKDDLGRSIFAFTIPIQTCNFDTAAQCADAGVEFFTRTVVPEPGTWGLMALGMGAMGLWVRRRRAD